MVAEYTFDCNRNNPADIYWEETTQYAGTCWCNASGQCHRHTYLSPMTISSIWGPCGIWGLGIYQVRLAFLINDTWVNKFSWDMQSDETDNGYVNSFYVAFQPVAIQGFRFETGEQGSMYGPYIRMSRGTVLAEQPEPECADYTNQTDCEAGGCYWWSDNTCHNTPEVVQEGFPWWIVVVVGVIATVALIKKR